VGVVSVLSLVELPLEWSETFSISLTDEISFLAFHFHKYSLSAKENAARHW
jgi:hypothetical protein